MKTMNRMFGALMALALLAPAGQAQQGIAAREALRASEAKYRSLVQGIQAAVVVHDKDTRIAMGNPKALELLGSDG